MQFIGGKQAVAKDNGQACRVFEYEFDDSKELNCAVVKLSGRYPESDLSLNKVCDEQVYVLAGRGSVAMVDGRVVELGQGDMIAINAGEAYCLEGQMELLIASSPAWSIDQYTTVKADEKGA